MGSEEGRRIRSGGIGFTPDHSKTPSTWIVMHHLNINLITKIFPKFSVCLAVSQKRSKNIRVLTGFIEIS